MIWMYTVEGKDFCATDVASFTQLMDVARINWVWIDVFDPNEKEMEILSELLGNKPEIVEKFKTMTDKLLDSRGDNYLFCDYEKINEFGYVTLPSIDFNEGLLVYPILLAKKKKMIITWGEEGKIHSKIVKRTIKRLREGIEAGQDLNSSLVISVLFHELAIKNSKIMLIIRERIDHLEESALENGGKKLIHCVFSLKRAISNLYRLMIEEKDFMLDVDKSMIALTNLNHKSRPIVDEAIEIIDRDLDFIDSYTKTLDSILTLQDLSSIHKVESSINYLTIILVIGTAILIFFEFISILGLLH